MPDPSGVISIREPLPAVMPARRPGIEIADFDTEVVVWDPASQMVHHLDGLAAVVFDACDGVTRTDDLIAEITEATGLERSAAVAEVTTVWAIFNRRNLFALPEPTVPRGQRRRRRA